MEDIGSAARGEGPMRGPCEVSVSPDPPADWDDYLGQHPDATIYHDARWGMVMQRAYRNRPFYLTARRGDKVVGVLQLIWQKSMLFGSHMCSLPYFDAAGVLADHVSAKDAVVSEATRLMEELRVDWLELRQSALIDETFPSRRDKVTPRLSLPESSDDLWQQLKPKVRNQIRKARRAALTLLEGQEELLGEFYGVYARNMRDLGSPPHSRRFFRLILESFVVDARLFVVRSGSRAIAAALALQDRHGLHVPWAASDWRLRELCANMLLYWSMLAYAADGGARCFDFGRSTRGSGTHRFKKQWGCDEFPLFWHYLLPEGRALPELRADSPKYRFMVACWKRLPLGLARLLGPRIIAKLS